MTLLTQKRFEILRLLSRYEDAYKKLIKWTSAEYKDRILNISSPMFEMARMYKNKINKLRKELKELE